MTDRFQPIRDELRRYPELPRFTLSRGTVTDLVEALATTEAALAESRGEVERLTRERDEAIATKVWLRQRLDETELTARTYASQARAAEEQRRTGL